MDCKYTCFDRVIHLTKKLPEEKLREAYEITIEDGLVEFLDFCVEHNCFSKEQSDVLYYFIVKWEDIDGNYWEEDYDKRDELYDAVGLTREVCDRIAEEIEEN